VDTNFYDVVVCGGETTGLVAGALLARRGFRVLLLGHEGDHPAFDAGGLTLSRAPALLPPLDEPPAARVFKELDSAALVRRRAPPARPPLRVVLPGQQLDLPAEAAMLDRELGRAFGGTAPGVRIAVERLGALARLIDPLLASAITLPPHGFWERREVGRLESLLPKPHTDLYAPLGAEHPFRMIAASSAALSTGLAPHEIGAVAEARAFELARLGPHLHEGGLAGLHDLFLGRLDTFGADRRERLQPVEIVLRRGRAVGVRVLPRDETIGCHHLIWAGPSATLHRALGSAAPAHHGARALRIAGYRHALSLLCEPGAIPEGTPPRIIAIGDPSRPLTEDNALAITIGAALARTPQRIPLWVECVVPPHAVEAGPGYLGALRGRLTHTLGRLLPTLPSRIALVASPYDGLPAEPSGASGARTNPSSSTPTPPPVFGLATPRPLDVVGLSHATGVKNLYLAGRENLPGLGLEGELTSGWGVARLVSGGQSRRNTPQRRMLLGD
jgi:phytoene dehydrogenase-like protein